MASALGFLLMATSVPLQWQQDFPTHEAADRWLADQIASRLKTTDANDTIYHFRASEDYDPSARLGEITAPLLAINSADDFVNPPELPMMEALITRVKRGRFVLVPVSAETRGHGTHSRPQVFGPHLAQFLKEIAR
jgi:homoserine O-acetyltransferase